MIAPLSCFTKLGPQCYQTGSRPHATPAGSRNWVRRLIGIRLPEIPANPRRVTRWTESRRHRREGWHNRRRNAFILAGPANTGCEPGLRHGNQYRRLRLRARRLAARRVAGRALRVGVDRRSAGRRRSPASHAVPLLALVCTQHRQSAMGCMRGDHLLVLPDFLRARATARGRMSRSVLHSGGCQSRTV